MDGVPSAAVASIIVLDEGEPDARAQIDIKLYRAQRRNSVGFETSGAGRDLYERLRRAASRRFEDAQEWQPAVRGLPE